MQRTEILLLRAKAENINGKVVNFTAINCKDQSKGYTSASKKYKALITEPKSLKYSLIVSDKKKTVVIENTKMVSQGWLVLF